MPGSPLLLTQAALLFTQQGVGDEAARVGHLRSTCSLNFLLQLGTMPLMAGKKLPLELLRRSKPSICLRLLLWLASLPNAWARGGQLSGCGQKSSSALPAGRYLTACGVHAGASTSWTWPGQRSLCEAQFVFFPLCSDLLCLFLCLLAHPPFLCRLRPFPCLLVCPLPTWPKARWGCATGTAPAAC